jgi:hypothetical protein
VVITLPNIKDTDEILELIFASLRNVDGLLIAYVITSTSVFKIEPKRSKQIPSTERKALTDDDVTNIIIAIENAKSIDDLLK